MELTDVILWFLLALLAFGVLFKRCPFLILLAIDIDMPQRLQAWIKCLQSAFTTKNLLLLQQLCLSLYGVFVGPRGGSRHGSWLGDEIWVNDVGLGYSAPQTIRDAHEIDDGQPLPMLDPTLVSKSTPFIAERPLRCRPFKKAAIERMREMLIKALQKRDVELRAIESRKATVYVKKEEVLGFLVGERATSEADEAIVVGESDTPVLMDGEMAAVEIQDLVNEENEEELIFLQDVEVIKTSNVRCSKACHTVPRARIWHKRFRFTPYELSRWVHECFLHREKQKLLKIHEGYAATTNYLTLNSSEGQPTVSESAVSDDRDSTLQRSRYQPVGVKTFEVRVENHKSSPAELQSIIHTTIPGIEETLKTFEAPCTNSNDAALTSFNDKLVNVKASAKDAAPSSTLHQTPTPEISKTNTDCATTDTDCGIPTATDTSTSTKFSTQNSHEATLPVSWSFNANPRNAMTFGAGGSASTSSAPTGPNVDVARDIEMGDSSAQRYLLISAPQNSAFSNNGASQNRNDDNLFVDQEMSAPPVGDGAMVVVGSDEDHAMEGDSPVNWEQEADEDIGETVGQEEDGGDEDIAEVATTPPPTTQIPTFTVPSSSFPSVSALELVSPATSFVGPSAFVSPPSPLAAPSALIAPSASVPPPAPAPLSGKKRGYSDGGPATPKVASTTRAIALLRGGSFTLFTPHVAREETIEDEVEEDWDAWSGDEDDFPDGEINEEQEAQARAYGEAMLQEEADDREMDRVFALYNESQDGKRSRQRRE